MITVKELCYLALEPHDTVTIESTTSCDTIFTGTCREAQFCEFGQKEVQSYYVRDNGLCINIETEE